MLTAETVKPTHTKYQDSTLIGSGSRAKGTITIEYGGGRIAIHGEIGAVRGRTPLVPWRAIGSGAKEGNPGKECEEENGRAREPSLQRLRANYFGCGLREC